MKKNEQKKDRLSLYLPPGMLDQIKNDAEEECRTITGHLTWIIQQYYKGKPESLSKAS